MLLLTELEGLFLHRLIIMISKKGSVGTELALKIVQVGPHLLFQQLLSLLSGPFIVLNLADLLKTLVLSLVC